VLSVKEQTQCVGLLYSEERWFTKGNARFGYYCMYVLLSFSITKITVAKVK
jgi:hypothetical protein